MLKPGMRDDHSQSHARLAGVPCQASLFRLTACFYDHAAFICRYIRFQEESRLERCINSFETSIDQDLLIATLGALTINVTVSCGKVRYRALARFRPRYQNAETTTAQYAWLPDLDLMCVKMRRNCRVCDIVL